MQHVSLPNHVPWVGGSLAAPQHRRPTLPQALGAPGTLGCPAWGSPRVARSSICRLASFPRAGRGGPVPSKPPAAPIQDWEGSDICAPCLDKVYKCLQRCPRPGGLWESGCSPPAGSNTGYGGGLQGPGRATGCSHRGLLDPGLSSTAGATAHLPWGATHTCHLTRSAEPVPEGTGCTHSMASTAPGARQQWCTALQAPEPSRHTTTCCPCTAGQAQGTGSFAPRFGGHQPWPPVPPMPSHPPRAQHCGDTLGGLASSTAMPVTVRAAAPTVVMPGTFCSDTQHPPWRCHPSLPSAASRVPTTPGCQPSPAPALGPSPTHAGCGQAAGRRAGRLQADALCLGLLQG